MKMEIIEWIERETTLEEKEEDRDCLGCKKKFMYAKFKHGDDEFDHAIVFDHDEFDGKIDKEIEILTTRGIMISKFLRLKGDIK